MKHKYLDMVLSPESILCRADVVLNVAGIKLSSHVLAQAGWSLRIRRKWRSRKRLHAKFQKHDNHICFSFESPVDDIDYAFSCLNESSNFSCIGTKTFLKGLGAYSDSQLLSELKKRNPFKSIKKNKNVIDIKKYISRYMAKEAA